MCQIITLVAVVLFAGLSVVSAKCDLMKAAKEFEPDIKKITEWAKNKCGADGKGDLDPTVISKIKECWAKSVEPKCTGDATKKLNTYINKALFDEPLTLTICKDKGKALIDKLKKSAMGNKEPCLGGMKGIMGIKKECEGDCDKWKTAVHDLANCVAP